MRIAIISLGGKSSKAIAHECHNFFEEVDELNLKDFEVRANGEIKVAHLKEDLKDYDCIYVKGSYKYALLQRAIARVFLGEAYLPVRPKAFAIGHDKFLTLLELQKNNVAIPRTHYVATKKNALKVLEEVEYPVILKLPEGTHGKGVLVAESLKSARTILDVLDDFKKPYIIQEFVKTEGTSDIRAIVAGGKVIASYQRVASDGEFRTNVHMGGKRMKHELTEEQKDLAIKSAEAVGANICGVDILNSDRPSVIEVNLSPSVYALEEITGVNVPRLIAKRLKEGTVKWKKRKKLREKKKLKKKNS